jgi:hypothetical protein
MNKRNVAFYCSEEPLTQAIRATVNLVGFDIDWHFNKYLEFWGNCKNKDRESFSQYLERSFVADGVWRNK